jgi:chloramphenicol O-acetyltransferase type A
MKIIDLEHWDRREHFSYFLKMDYPQFNICAPVDVTKFSAYVKDRNLSFYHAMIYAVTAAANRVENLRYRIRDGAVILHDRVHPSYTSMDKETGLFKYVMVSMGDDINEFVRRAREKEQAQKGLFGDGTDETRDDLVYLSCLPWISFTQVSHTVKLDRDDSIPRITWGKYYADGNRTMMPLSVQVHHALADGYHAGMYFTALQGILDTF